MMMINKIVIAWICAVCIVARAQAGSVDFVAESNRNSLWELQSSSVPPRLGMYLRPGYSVAFEIEYTIQSDGTVSDARVTETTDAALPIELLMELIGSHLYRPGAQNEARAPIRTRMQFRLGAPAVGTAEKVCPGSADAAQSTCPN